MTSCALVVIFVTMGQMDQNKKKMTMSMQLIVVLLFLPNASLIFFINDDELHVHHHFLYKVTKIK
jgi:hypothetical protein